MSAYDRCPECGSTCLIRDGSTGEVVCGGCGFVVGEVEYAPPYTGNRGRGCFSLTSFAKTTGKPRFSGQYAQARYIRMVGRLGGGERTEMALATRIATMAERLGLPKHVEEQAMLLGRRLLEGMRTTGRRLTVLDMSAVALWGACKVMGIPISMDEFTEALGLHNGTSLFKLLSKAQRIASMPKKTFEAKDYVGRIAGKLSGMADPRYVSALESYARSICDSAGEALRGRDPVCAAATSLCVADETLGGWIGRERITEASGAGYSLSLAHKLRAAVPPPHISMRKLALEFIEKRVVEVKTDEVVRHVAS